MPDEPTFTCPRCGWTSHNPNDIREGYCGHCHDWTRQAGIPWLREEEPDRWSITDRD